MCVQQRAFTFLGYALWKVNKEKTRDESHTHGEMVKGFIHARCQVRVSNHKGSKRNYLEFDTEVRRFASLISNHWPKSLLMTPRLVYLREL